MVEEGTTKPCVVKAFNLDEKELTEMIYLLSTR
jgi:hypothetical protein